MLDVVYEWVMGVEFLSWEGYGKEAGCMGLRGFRGVLWWALWVYYLSLFLSNIIDFFVISYVFPWD